MDDVIGSLGNAALDFLRDAGTAQTEQEFDDFVSVRLGELIPTDQPCTIVVNEAGCGPPVAVRGDSALVRDFNAYFRFKLPVAGDYLFLHRFVDFRDFRRSEYYRDFLRIHGVRYVLGSYSGYIPNLFRSARSRPFGERECLVFEAVAPHLNNLHTYLKKISCLSRAALARSELAYDCRALSRREAEIVRYLAFRMTSREIASLLFISPRTVEKHIENAFEKIGVADRTSLLAKLRGIE